jgi:hypothetical protein
MRGFARLGKEVLLAMLSDACATATIRADELTAQISDLRDRWSGRTARQGDHPEKLRIEVEQRLKEQKALQRQRPIEADILGRCRAWLAALPPGTVLEQIIPDVEDSLALGDVRARQETEGSSGGAEARACSSV